MPQRNVVTWTAMITSNNSRNNHMRAWSVFPQMLRDGVKALSCGQLVHSLAIKIGVQGSSVYVDNSLMDMYATCCDSMDRARMVFDDITTKTDVCWTTLITGYTHRGDAYGGLRVFRQMFLEEGALSLFSFSIAARACASIGSGILGKQVHAEVVKHGFESNLPVMNSILDIIGFQRVSMHIFTNGVRRFSPDCFSFTSAVGACANLAVLYCGQQLHGVIVRSGLDNYLEISNALIYMYAKCGNIADSRKIFSKMPCTNLVSWTSMINGYGDHGYGKDAVELFNEMIRSGIKPDKMVFMAVLSACSHAGLVDEGLRYFRLMTSYYNITPDIEIYGCVVDLFGRAGRVKEAYQLIENMPFNPDESIWAALLGACKVHNQPSVAKFAALRALDMNPISAGTYALI
ncbi:putative pentatricopeptide repeat-containing protein [Glycine soja]